MRVELQIEAEHVAMALPDGGGGGGGGIMQQWEAEASSLPMGEQRHEGRLLLRLWDFFCFFVPGRRRGILIPQYTHTQKPK